MLGGKKRIISSWMFDTVKRNIKNTRFFWLEKWSKNNKSPGSWKKGNIPWNKGKKTRALTFDEKQKRSDTAKKYWSQNTHPRKNKSPWNKDKKGLQEAWNKGTKAFKIQCTHCSKIVGGEGNFKRWHGDNCKMRVAG